MYQTSFLSKFKISPNVHNYSTSTTTFITNSLMSKIIAPIHQQHVFQTSLTTINHEIHSKFIEPQLHYSSFFTKTQHFHIYDF